MSCQILKTKTAISCATRIFSRNLSVSNRCLGEKQSNDQGSSENDDHKHAFKKYPRSPKDLFNNFKLLLGRFKSGFKEFRKGCWHFYRVANSESFKDFSREELDNYRQIGRDILKVSPVLIVFQIPFASFVVLPFAFCFPGKALSRQFWTEDELINIKTKRVKDRLYYYPKIVEFLETQTELVEDRGHRDLLEDSLREINQGAQLDVKRVLELQPVFSAKPLDFDDLYKHHLTYMRWSISRSWQFPGRYHRMSNQARLLHFSNLAIHREGIDSMTPIDLQTACMYRGLLCSSLSEQDLRNYLKSWVTLSQNISVGSSLSLLLHSHVLMAINHPGNAQHITEVKQKQQAQQ